MRDNSGVVLADKLAAYSLSLTGAYEDHPFGPDTLIVKLRGGENRPGKIFAQFYYLTGQRIVNFQRETGLRIAIPADEAERVYFTTLKCSAEYGDFMRRQYPGLVVRGYHCPPIQQPYFSSLPLDGSIPYEEIIPMIGHAYEEVLKGLPKKDRLALEKTP